MTQSAEPADESSRRADRVAAHARVAGALGQMSDADIADLLRSQPVLGSGIGGLRQTLTIAGSTVFVKRIPLTDVERGGPSTANHFGLPPMCQYGVGAPSFGAWREVAANTMATGWFEIGQVCGHPMTHDVRVLDESSPHGAWCDELGDVDRLVDHWHGSAAVRRRAEAMVAATATVVVFQEFVPMALTDWLRAEYAGDPAVGDAALDIVTDQLIATVVAMNERGLFHFDGHLGNVLTDGHEIRLADFGLATSMDFDLSPAETDFLLTNASHDVAFAVTRLVDWVVAEFVTGDDHLRRNEVLRGWRRERGGVTSIPAAARRLVDRYVELAVVVNDFYQSLHLVSRDTPYPQAAVENVCRSLGVTVPHP